MAINLAAVKAYAIAHKTQLMAGGAAAAVGGALVIRKRNASSPSSSSTADPGATPADSAPAASTAGYDGSGYGTDPSTLLAMVLTQQTANATALQHEVQSLERGQISILARLGKHRRPHHPAPRPPHVIHGTWHPPGVWPHPPIHRAPVRRRRRRPLPAGARTGTFRGVPIRAR